LFSQQSHHNILCLRWLWTGVNKSGKGLGRYPVEDRTGKGFRKEERGFVYVGIGAGRDKTRRRHEMEKWDESTERNQVIIFFFEVVAGLLDSAGSICIYSGSCGYGCDDIYGGVEWSAWCWDDVL